MPFLSNMKSSYIEDTDFIVFKFSFITWPKSCVSVWSFQMSFSLKKSVLWESGVCLVTFISGQNSLQRTKAITLLEKSHLGYKQFARFCFFCLERQKLMNGNFFPWHHQRNYFLNSQELNFFQGRKWTCGKTLPLSHVLL